MRQVTGKTNIGASLRSLALPLLSGLFAASIASAQGTITSINPPSIPAGNPQFTLQVNTTGLPQGTPVVYFNQTQLQTTAGTGGILNAIVPTGLILYPQVVYVYVLVGNTATSAVTFSVTGAAISSLQPSSAPVNGPSFTLTVNGAGFYLIGSETPTIYFGSQPLTTNFVSSTQLTGTVPSAYLNQPGTVQVYVMEPDESTSGLLPFFVGTPIQIAAVPMPAGTVGTPYDFTFQATGGTGSLTYSVPGLPTPLRINPSTGEVTGTPTSQGNYSITLTVTDSLGQSASRQFGLQIQAPVVVPLQITTTSLPNGQVAVIYYGAVAAIGGSGSYTFSLASSTAAANALPPGLTISSSGGIGGVPTTAGTTRFAVQVQDSAGTVATATLSITIVPPAFAITTGALAASPAGTPLSITFTAIGGTPPYTFSASTGIPTGATLNSNGALTGTPTTQGSYQFTVTAKDSTGLTVSKSFSLTIAPPVISIVTTTLPNGQAGTPYSVQLFASGGQTPYAWTATGAPAGVVMSSTGLLSGTPTGDGTFTIAVTVADVLSNHTTQSYTVTIAAAPLVITTGSLPSDVAGTAYAAISLTATGGDAPYTWTAQGLPTGLTLSPAGSLSGTPTVAGTSSVVITVTDSKKVSATATFILTVTAVPLSIATTSLPNGTVQSAYSDTLAASGGAGSLKWSASNLPTGLSISTAGVISGTPTAAGQSVVVVTATDSAGTVAVQTYSLTVLLPPTPTVNISGLPATGTPGTQSNLQVGLGSSYPVAATALLTLTFTPDSGSDDPTVQFSSGGRNISVQLPAGSTSTGNVPLQFGTVAGTITITAQLTAAGQNITPTPAPQQTVRIAAAAPVISSVTAVRGSSGFTVTVIGFATPRQVTQATFTFAAPSSANLQTSSVSIPVTSLFTSWYSSSASTPYGSQFSFVQPFAVTGSVQGITSVTVTLTNAQGTSTPVTATLQ